MANEQIDELLSWIRQNIDTQDWSESGEEVLEALIWAMAMCEAELMQDMGNKDMAHMLVEGIKPISEEDVANWIEEWREEENDQIPQELKDYLKEFWRGKKLL